MQKNAVEIIYLVSRTEWRLWLQKNHSSKQSIWLVFYKKASSKPTLSWREAVDEALCFGWIDSKKVAIDKEKSHQIFSKRKTKSTWSKINKEKIKHLIDEGLMTKAGFEIIETARQNGSWEILDEVEELVIPKDLEEKFKTKENAKGYFLSLSKSTKKAILQWIVLARRQETRQVRITEFVELADKKQKPKQF